MFRLRYQDRKTIPIHYIKDMVRGLLQCMTDRNIGNHYSTDMHFFFKIILIFLKDIV